MQTIELVYPHHLKAIDLPKAVCAIGFFDGIHLGHQKVIEKAVKEAQMRQMESVVITFHPHPSVVLKTDAAKKEIHYITPLRQKEMILESMHVDKLYIIKFDPQLASLSPQQFIDHFIIGLNIAHIVAGFDFTYGNKGSGTMDNINGYSGGLFTSTTIDKFEIDHEKVSSSKIRELLKIGEVEKVAVLLGRRLAMSGLVIDGDKRGRTIGYPTANLEFPGDAKLPKPGVYAVRILHNQHVYEGMANLGMKPTIANIAPKLTLEVHIFDYDQDIYGETLQIEWCTYIRAEQKFSGIDALIGQLKQDELDIRAYFLEIE